MKSRYLRNLSAAILVTGIASLIITAISWFISIGVDRVIHLGTLDFFLLAISIWILLSIWYIRQTYASVKSRRFVYFTKGRSGNFEVIKKSGFIADLVFRTKRVTIIPSGEKFIVTVDRRKFTLSLVSSVAIHYTEDLINSIRREDPHDPILSPDDLLSVITKVVIHNEKAESEQIILESERIEVPGTHLHPVITDLKSGKPEMTFRICTVSY